MGNNDCSVLVMSCDAYEDAWHPFFSLLSKMWPDCKYPIYLCSESKDYKIEGMPIKCLHPDSLIDKRGKPISWSNRLKQALKKINSDYVLFFLEDFFLMSPVRVGVVSECVLWMEQDPKLGVIDFFHEPYEHFGAVGEFSPVDKKYTYCINAMSALWRKSFLMDILRDNESPWEFEFNGTYRWRRTDVRIYTHRREFAPVFDYPNVPKYGYGIFQGEWLWNNKDLFEKNGIKADFSMRPTIQYGDLPPLERPEREKNWILADLKRTIRDPSLISHYLKCFVDIMKYERKKFCARWFKR